MPEIWAGMDIGKEHHHCVVIDARGERLLSRRVLNDEAALLDLVDEVLALSAYVLWAVDTNHGGASLLLDRGQPMVYITGLAVHRASAAYRGQGKTDAKDAFVIAGRARMRTDLGVLRPGEEIAVDLRTLTARRADLVNDRTRTINRLRAQLLEIFPALERALNLTNKGPVTLLTGYQTPDAIRRLGARRLEAWLRRRKVKGAGEFARAAVPDRWTWLVIAAHWFSGIFYSRHRAPEGLIRVFSTTAIHPHGGRRRQFPQPLHR